MVKLTEYVLPNGKQREVNIPLSPQHEEKAASIINANGFSFAGEVLNNGLAVFYICGSNRDIDMFVTQNWDKAASSLEYLIDRFDLKKAQEIEASPTS